MPNRYQRTIRRTKISKIWEEEVVQLVAAVFGSELNLPCRVRSAKKECDEIAA